MRPSLTQKIRQCSRSVYSRKHRYFTLPDLLHLLKSMKGLVFLGIFVLISMSSALAKAPEEPAKKRKIEVLVYGDEVTRDRLQVCLERELSELKDIEIISAPQGGRDFFRNSGGEKTAEVSPREDSGNIPEWTLEVAVAQFPILVGRGQDFAFSVLIRRAWQRGDFKLSGISFSKSVLHRLENKFTAYEKIYDHQLKVGFPTLPSGCQQIVAEFAAGYLGIVDYKPKRQRAYY